MSTFFPAAYNLLFILTSQMNTTGFLTVKSISVCLCVCVHAHMCDGVKKVEKEEFLLLGSLILSIEKHALSQDLLGLQFAFINKK